MTNLYDFQPLTAQSSLERLLPEALTFGGVNLDKELAGYRTLNVSGRENFTRTVNTASSTADGELFVSSKLDAHEITIKYQLNADSIDDFNKKYTRLKFILQGDEQPFFFADENEFIRYGTVTSLALDDAGVIQTTGSIVIKMTNPFRFGQTKTVVANGNLVVNDPQLSYEQAVDRFYLTIGVNTQNAVLNINNDYNLTLNTGYNAGDIIIIDMKTFDVTVGGNSQLRYIDITKSNIFESLVKNGDVITSPNAGTIKIDYRIKML